MNNTDYFKLLKEKFPNKSSVLTEIINLDAINHLPKGTEHFVSDLHGEYDAFDYLLRNGSGTIKHKVIECFPEWKNKPEKINNVCQLIYYPEEKIEQMSSKGNEETEKWLIDLIPSLINLVQFLGSKYTQSKIHKMLPVEFSYIIEELLSEGNKTYKNSYLNAIIDKISSLGKIEDLVISFCYLLQKLVMDHLHVVGDIFDRGKNPDKILDRLESLNSVDIQWGNHDITWMGAISGSPICMVNVIRIAARYNNLSLIENRYGINLRELIDYCRKYYEPIPTFNPIIDEGEITTEESNLLNVVQQGTAILQFKLEEKLIQRRPEFLMEHRRILSRIDYKNRRVEIKGSWYELTDFNSTCISKSHVDKLSNEESDLLSNLLMNFQHSEKLQRQVEYLFSKGSMYLVYNNQLLFHGCIPLHSNGDFKSLKIKGKNYSGKQLLDFYEEQIRKSYHSPDKHDDFSTDIFWYLWSGEISSLFGKESMTTFERYFIKDKNVHIEKKNPYYSLRNEREVCISILKEFGLVEESHIINGHTPVIEKRGEEPIKAFGKLLVIDGGISKGYQRKTGIAGYTLVSNSYGLEIIAHKPFYSVEDVLKNNNSTIFNKRIIEKASKRILVGDTNKGIEFTKTIKKLEYLYEYFEDF